jgi:hypothetical protein
VCRTCSHRSAHRWAMGTSRTCTTSAPSQKAGCTSELLGCMGTSSSRQTGPWTPLLVVTKKRGPTNQQRTGSAGGDHGTFVHGRRASKAAQQRKRKTWGDSLPAHAMKDDHQLPRGAVQRRHRRAGHVPVLFHPSPLGRGPLGVQHNVHQRGRGCSRLQGLDDGVRGPRLHIRTIDGHHPAANCRGKHRHARSARSWSEGRRTAPPLLRGVLSTPTPTNQMGGRSRQLNQRLGQ